MAKKILAVMLVFISLLVFNANLSYAAETPTPTPSPTPGSGSSSENVWSPSEDAKGFEEYRNAIDEDGCMTPSLECLVHQVFRFTALEFVNSSLYTEFKPTITGDNPNGGKKVAGSGLLYGAGKLIGQMYAHPAANTGVYIADIMNSAHITPQAYAQGLGFAALNPILELWKAFRNIAYMFFVLIFIIIGFMIMFRQRIGGQAAITAQQAIPNIIVSLILVTFSYAISGFAIDLMYVLMFLIIGVFGQTLPTGSENLIDMTILQVMGALFKATNVANPMANADLVSNLFGSLIVNEGVNSFLSVAGGLTLSIVLAVAILIGTIKLFFELLKSYASVILSVVTSPVVLMMGALPGKNAFTPWFKDLIGNLLPFPVVLLVLVVFYQFANLTGAGNEGGFIPPFLIARGQSGAIASLMGLALILALPEIVKDVKKGLVKEGFGTMVFKAATENAKQGFPLGGRVGLGTVGATVGGTLGGLAGGAAGFGKGVKQAGSTLARGGSLGKAGGTLVSSTIGGLASGYKYKDKAGNVKTFGGALRGARAGAGYGIRATSELSSRAAIRQPDYLNPATKLLDRLDPKTAEKEQKRQEDEDRLDLLAKTLSGRKK